MTYRSPLLFAGISGFCCVALGAFGAHWLNDVLTERNSRHIWETAVHYQFIHTLALFLTALWLKLQGEAPHARLIWAARWWALGLVLFSGSLYGLALGGPRILGPITPLGGLSLLMGWGSLIAAGLQRETSR